MNTEAIELTEHIIKLFHQLPIASKIAVNEVVTQITAQELQGRIDSLEEDLAYKKKTLDKILNHKPL